MDTLDFLGVKFDRKLRSDPHIRSLISATALLAGITRHLSVHLPPEVACDVVSALLVGKLNYGIAAAFFPRLSSDDSRASLSSDLQTRVNDVARAIMGLGRASSPPITDLLKETGLPSVNRLAVRSVAIEALKSLRAPQQSGDQSTHFLIWLPHNFQH